MYKNVQTLANFLRQLVDQGLRKTSVLQRLMEGEMWYKRWWKIRGGLGGIVSKANQRQRDK